MIDADFECGNIVVGQISDDTVHLSIRPDSNAQFYQWFYFQVHDGQGQPVRFVIDNASGASYPVAWNGYDVLSSADGEYWRRLPTEYDGQVLSFTDAPSNASTSYAYFVPYVAAQREHLLKTCGESGRAQRTSLGQSGLGRSLDLLTLGSDSPQAVRIWVVTRQHAGESMAEWAVEGFLKRLISDDAAAQSLLARARVYVVPNANPDGSALGNLRANANGVDLNRVWENPPDSAPEIVHLRRAIEETGVDLFLDVHGDEERPFIWLMHPEVETTPEIDATQVAFESALAARNPEVQPRPNLVDGVKHGDLGLSVNFITAHYGVPGWIIELPNKAVDFGNGPDSLLADGCQRFGASMVEALLDVLPA